MKELLVLMLHEINDVSWFEGILAYLGKKYQFISYDALHAVLTGKSDISKAIHLTFDDGHKSFYTNALPVLKRQKAAATLFVSPQAVQQEENFWFQRIRPFDKSKWQAFVIKHAQGHFHSDISGFSPHSIMKSMPLQTMHQLITQFETENKLTLAPYVNVSTQELREIQQSGLVEIGAHTLHHPILANENDKDSANQIRMSVEGLKDLLNTDVRCFAYPNGQPGDDFGQREMDTLKSLGIEIAFSTQSSRVYRGSDLLSIPRVGVSKGNNYFVTQKIRFARQWQGIKNLVFRQTEQKERKALREARIEN
ncbi:MAG: polysaccharide deacetylase family protein [Candidatus Cloacimonetes bacterium]|nr:polysaccharide deacetylase family protein [Candidatus Cloacimonadota bacterium]